MPEQGGTKFILKGVRVLATAGFAPAPTIVFYIDSGKQKLYYR
jgi:hypothetical protein